MLVHTAHENKVEMHTQCAKQWYFDIAPTKIAIRQMIPSTRFSPHESAPFDMHATAILQLPGALRVSAVDVSPVQDNTSILC